MDKRSIEVFDRNRDYILTEVAGRFNITPTDLKTLGSFESRVYEFMRGGQAFILKITHSFHRTAEQIGAELDWIDFLADGDLPVSRAVPSVNGEPVEKIEVEDSYFLAYAFGKSPGRHVTEGEWNDDLFRNWGRLTGRMHALAKTYVPPDGFCRRFHWHEDESLRVEKYIPAEQPAVIDKCNTLKRRLRKLPTDSDGYGMIHSDLHHGNFFVNNGEIIPFDFDDCHYSFYAYDIGIPLFYALRSSYVKEDKPSFARRFLWQFMAGYRKETRIDSSWLKYIPDFMKLREMDLCIIIYAEGEQNYDQWCRDYMKGRREKIENDVPIIDIDFSEFG